MATPSTILERRWFTTGPMANGEWAGTFVEATTEFGANLLPVIQREVRSLLDLHLKNVACTASRWDEKAFRYLHANESVPACKFACEIALR